MVVVSGSVVRTHERKREDMTRKDYQKVADIIRKHLNEAWDDSAELAVGNIAQDLAGMFATDNERFNPSMFYKACGINYLSVTEVV